MSQFTRREIIVLVLFVLLIVPFALTPQQTIRSHEELILVSIITPLGFLIATDPERMK